MPWLLLLIPMMAFAEVKTEKIIYEKNGVKMHGLIAYDDKDKKPKPGIVIFSDWMGNGPYSEMRAKQLAQEGYVALAADVYGEGKRPKDAKQAQEWASAYRADRKLMRERAQAAFETLATHPRADLEKLVAIGYCFGGTVALELARSGAPLKGVVSFHGNLATPMKAKKMEAKILILHGADDPFVPEKEVLEFQQEMREAKADWQFVSYGNTVHSFTQKEAGNNPSKGAAYNPVSEKRAWNQMEEFFDELF